MITQQVIYIFLIAILSICTAVFQYFYKAKVVGSDRFIFAFLRFLTFFILGLLFINPVITNKEIINTKPNLIVAIDKSESIRFLKKDSLVTDFVKKIKQSNLKDKFNIDYYLFGDDIKKLNDSITFTDKQTNITQVFSTLKELYSNSNSPTLLLTDGNQTIGSDYIQTSLNYKNSIYPIIVGDSIFNNDLLIKKIQLNKYAFLGNEFPVEITVSYQGLNTIKKEFSIFINGNKVVKKRLTLSKNSNTAVVEVLLKANSIGKKKYKAKIAAIKSEKNIKNNSQDFSINVIDERTNVLIISDISHPDLGALKNSIESNKQRKVTILNPLDKIDYNSYQLLVLYQPSVKFKSVFKNIDSYNKNYLTVTGLQTDWSFLNYVSKNYQKNSTENQQEFLPYKNSAFNLFQYEDLVFDAFPPLEEFYGTLKLKNAPSIILNQKINNIETKQPLFCFFETNKQREAVLFGEGLWKWRAQSYLNNNEFIDFDALIGKTVQYLSSKFKKDRLIINNKETYFLGETILEAQYFDNNFVFNPNEIIFCKIKNIKTKEIFNYEFLYNKNNYALDLSHLLAGDYNYEIKVENQNITKKGSFNIIDFNIESQFVNPNVTNMQQLATNSKTKLRYLFNAKNIIKELNNNKNYKTVQSESISEKELINWKYLIALLISTLSLEWFLRKYKGLI